MDIGARLKNGFLHCKFVFGDVKGGLATRIDNNCCFVKNIEYFEMHEAFVWIVSP